jgi:hypothetical protein
MWRKPHRVRLRTGDKTLPRPGQRSTLASQLKKMPAAVAYLFRHAERRGAGTGHYSLLGGGELPSLGFGHSEIANVSLRCATCEVGCATSARLFARTMLNHRDENSRAGRSPLMKSIAWKPIFALRTRGSWVQLLPGAPIFNDLGREHLGLFLSGWRRASRK